MKIAVYCSAEDVDELYQSSAKELASLLAQHGHSLVWGASDTGLMKIVADVMHEAGAEIVGVTMPYYANVARKHANEIVIAKDLGERKAIMLERCEAMIILPGGIGTLDEITDAMELKKQGYHSKPLVVINIDGYYKGLIEQLETMQQRRFITKPYSRLVDFVESPQQALERVESQS